MKNLHVRFKTQLGVVSALNGVSFTVPRGKVVGVVGESGSGKTITGLAIMQLIQPPGRITEGQLLLHEEPGEPPVDILEHSRTGEWMRKIRGDQVGMIFQEPMTSLNPSSTRLEPDRGGDPRDPPEQESKGGQRPDDRILDRVSMPNPEIVYKRYPHELSGGMRQRAMIAMALSCEPGAADRRKPSPRPPSTSPPRPRSWT